MGASTPRVIVRRDRPDLYTYLRCQFGPTVTVIIDRREASIAGPPLPASVPDRREALTPHDALLWRTLGYHLCRLPDPDLTVKLGAEVYRHAQALLTASPAAESRATRRTR